MGTWTDVDLYRVSELINADAMDVIKGNIEYLHAPNYAEYHDPGSGSDYTVTGTFGQDIDANFVLSLTTYGGLVAACFYGVWQCNSTGSIRANIARTDPISHIGANMFNNFAVEILSTTSNIEPRGWIQFFPGLPAGTHEFRAVWGIGVGTGTLFASNRPYMAVWEV